MRALILKLSSMDSETEAALRVIAYFDALAMRSASSDMIVRGAAAIAEATAGVTLADGASQRFDPSGARLKGLAGRGRREHTVGQTTVWLERDGESEPLDDLILERFALAVATSVREQGATPPTALSDPAALEVILSNREPLAERSVALRRLGLVPDAPAVMIAVDDHHEGDGVGAHIEMILRDLSPRVRARGARLGSLGAVIVQAPPGPESGAVAAAVRTSLVEGHLDANARVRCGIGVTGPALDAPAGWESARTALRFARRRASGLSTVDAAELGPVAQLVHVSPDQWLMDPRVKTVRAWADDESGSIDLDVLEAYLTCGSLRMAGQFLHMHHSSVASRLARVEEKLDLDLTMPAGLFHARLCLYAATLAANE